MQRRYTRTLQTPVFWSRKYTSSQIRRVVKLSKIRHFCATDAGGGHLFFLRRGWRWTFSLCLVARLRLSAECLKKLSTNSDEFFDGWEVWLAKVVRFRWCFRSQCGHSWQPWEADHELRVLRKTWTWSRWWPYVQSGRCSSVRIWNLKKYWNSSVISWSHHPRSFHSDPCTQRKTTCLFVR